MCCMCSYINHYIDMLCVSVYDEDICCWVVIFCQHLLILSTPKVHAIENCNGWIWWQKVVAVGVMAVELLYLGRRDCIKTSFHKHPPVKNCTDGSTFLCYLCMREAIELITAEYKLMSSLSLSISQGHARWYESILVTA